MRNKRIFFRYLAFALEIILLWVLQSTPKLLPELLGAKPFLLLSAALAFAVSEDVVPSVILGAVCGALADISADGTVGYFSVAFTLVCFAEASILGTYLNKNILTASVFSLGASVVVIGLYFLLFRVFAGYDACGELFVGRYLFRMIYTFIGFIPLYFLNRFLHKSFS